MYRSSFGEGEARVKALRIRVVWVVRHCTERLGEASECKVWQFKSGAPAIRFKPIQSGQW